MRCKFTKTIIMVTKLSLKVLVVLFVTLNLALASAGSAQVKSVKEVKISLRLKNATLREVFRQIEQKTDFSFNFSQNRIDLSRRIDIDFEETTVEQVLLKISGEMGLGFKQVNNSIGVNKRQKNTPQRTVSMVVLQEQTITGKVTDETGEPLPGATVIEKGTANGTVTDMNGEFSLTVSGKDAVLVFSFVGYQSEEMALGEQTRINMLLVPDITTLGEIIVVGYGTQKKSSLTGSVEQITVNELVDQPNTTMATAIQGRLSGVLINSPSGAPGGDFDTEILIRGVSTLNDPSPLILIDGMVSTMSDFMTIDINDVASVSVLKDAASSAIYGNRAANGVLLVTTKRGEKEEKISGSYNGFVGVQKAINLPDLMNSWEYLEWRNRGELKQGRPPLATQEEINLFRGGADPFQYPNYQPFEEFLRTSLMQNHNLSFSGGSKMIRFATSLGYRAQEGIERFNEFDQINFRTNIDASFLEDKLDFQLNITRISSENTYPATSLKGTRLNRSSALGIAIKQAPTTQVINPDGTYGHPNIALYNSGGWGSAKRDKYTTLAKLSYEPVNDLEVSVSYGLDRVVEQEKAFVPAYTYVPNFFVNPTPQTAISELYEGESFLDYNNLGMFISYKKLLAEKHFLEVLLGNTYEHWEDDNFGIYGTDLISNGSPYIENIRGETTTRSGASEKGMISYFGRANYEYAGKYLMEFTMRYDGSSVFRGGNRWGMFPSASIGWTISEEPFFQSVSWVDDLKVRASYGILGNDKVGRYVTFDQITLDQDYNFGGDVVSTARIANVGNEDITWEKVTNWNAGVDVTLFNTIDLTVDLFRRVTSDILQEVPAPYVFGYEGDGITSNFAEIENSGVEVVLGYEKSVGDFRFGAKLNASYIKNKVTKLSLDGVEGDRGYIGFNDGWNIVREGDPFLALFGFEVGGIISSEEQLASLYEQFDSGENSGEYAVTGLEEIGDWFYVDQNGDGRIDEEDKVILGSPFPEIQTGLNLSANWKGLDLSMFFQGVLGHKSFSTGILVDPYSAGSAKISRLYTDSWRPEVWVPEAELAGQSYFSTRVENGEIFYLVDRGNLSSNIPVGENNKSKSRVAGNSYFAQDASYLRLSNVSLGYTLPGKFINKTFMNSVRIYTSVTNVFTLTNYLDFDPENAIRENDNTFNYPQTRNWNAGIRVSF